MIQTKKHVFIPISVKKILVFKEKLSSYNTIDLLRWLFYKLTCIRIYPYRFHKSALYFKRLDVHIGKNVTFSGMSFNLNVGKDLVIYNNCIFEFGLNSKMHIGNSCLLSYGVLIQNNKSITIGNHVQIGEYTSIRDTTHNHSLISKPMKHQGDHSEPIVIGNDVWIGKGCIILPGTIIEDGVIIGANSVVKGTLCKNSVYAGAPLKLIKQR